MLAPRSPLTGGSRCPRTKPPACAPLSQCLRPDRCRSARELRALPQPSVAWATKRRTTGTASVLGTVEAEPVVHSASFLLRTDSAGQTSCSDRGLAACRGARDRESPRGRAYPRAVPKAKDAPCLVGATPSSG